MFQFHPESGTVVYPVGKADYTPTDSLIWLFHAGPIDSAINALESIEDVPLALELLYGFKCMLAHEIEHHHASLEAEHYSNGNRCTATFQERVTDETGDTFTREFESHIHPSINVTNDDEKGAE